MSSEPVSDTIIEKNVDLLRSRHHVGMRKYGVPLDRANEPPDAWVQHAIEETADKLNYLQKLKTRFIPNDRELEIILEALRQLDGFTSDRELAMQIRKKILAMHPEL